MPEQNNPPLTGQPTFKDKSPITVEAVQALEEASTTRSTPVDRAFGDPVDNTKKVAPEDVENELEKRG